MSRFLTSTSPVRHWTKTLRRNLNNWQQSQLALRLEDIFREKAKKQRGMRTDINISQKSAKGIDTREELAKIAGVSHDTIAKAKKIEETGIKYKVI